MISTLKNNYSKLSLYLIGIISMALIYFFMWRTDAIGYSSVIGGDGNDYYSYLMSIFIDKNLGHQDTSPWFVIQTPTGTINVHMIGVSLMLLPFFLIGLLWSNIGGYDINGISEPFQKMISIGALFYLMMGLYFIRRILLKQNYSEKTVAIVLLLIFSGTNLLNYAINEPTMSHVYSFALIAAFLYGTFKMMTQPSAKNFIFTAIVSALIVLIRPTNILIVFIIPLWFKSWNEFTSAIKNIYIQHKVKVIVAKLVFFGVLFLQSIVWFFQNGKLLQWSYKDNGMYLFSPNTIKMLFGFNAGFFIYTPLCLLLLFGLFPMYKDNRYHFMVLSLFFLFTFYFLSCHWAYTYFDGLSIRALVDFLPVFAISGAALVNQAFKTKLKSLVLSGISITVLFNLMICYQYKAGIIPPAGMNYEKFKYILFKTDKRYAGVLGGCNDITPYSKKHPEAALSFESTFNETENFNYNDKEYGVAYEVPQLGFTTSKIYVKVQLRRKEAIINSSENALLVLHIEARDKSSRNFQCYKLNDTPSESCCEWQTWDYAVTMDGKIQAGDKFIVYIWNKEKKEFYIDDFKVEVYNYNYTG